MDYRKLHVIPLVLKDYTKVLCGDIKEKYGEIRTIVLHPGAEIHKSTKVMNTRIAIVVECDKDNVVVESDKDSELVKGFYRTYSSPEELREGFRERMKWMVDEFLVGNIEGVNLELLGGWVSDIEKEIETLAERKRKVEEVMGMSPDELCDIDASHLIVSYV